MNEKLNTSKIIMNWFMPSRAGWVSYGVNARLFSLRCSALGNSATAPPTFCVKLVSIRSMTLRKFAAFLNVSETFPVFEQLRK